MASHLYYDLYKNNTHHSGKVKAFIVTAKCALKCSSIRGLFYCFNCRFFLQSFLRIMQTKYFSFHFTSFFSRRSFTVGLGILPRNPMISRIMKLTILVHSHPIKFVRVLLLEMFFKHFLELFPILFMFGHHVNC